MVADESDSVRAVASVSEQSASVVAAEVGDVRVGTDVRAGDAGVDADEGADEDAPGADEAGDDA